MLTLQLVYRSYVEILYTFRLFNKGIMSNAEFIKKFSFTTYCQPVINENLLIVNENHKFEFIIEELKQVCLK